MELITIRTYQFPAEVQVDRLLLESEGIECFAADELTISADPLLSNAIGGIKLQVRDADAEKALAILENGASNSLDGQAD